MKSISTVYEGFLTDHNDVLSEVLVTVDGAPLDPGPSQRLHNHSPDGFAWGYGGSGPAQLALGILLDFYGPNAPELRYYQEFKQKVVANFPRQNDWTITGNFIFTTIKAIMADSRRMIAKAK